jgi:hypothetical protein
MFTSKHNPNGGATPHCDNGRIESLIAEYQTTRDVNTLASIVDLTQDRALTLIRFRKTTRYSTEGELLSDVNFKLIRAVDKFDRSKGTAFTFMSQVVMNTLCTSVTSARKRYRQSVKLDQRIANKLVTNGETESQHAIDDLAHRIRSSVKTTLTDPSEVGMQRWYVDSFLDGAFELRRHQCADAAMQVYGVSHERSRELYDLTVLEVRRVLYPDLPPRQPIAAGRLLGTRCAWMTRYAHLLNAVEFTKFVTLTKNLSPFVVVLIDPANHSRRQDRCPAISRRNLEFILNGHPDARLLFERKEGLNLDLVED